MSLEDWRVARPDSFQFFQSLSFFKTNFDHFRDLLPTTSFSQHASLVIVLRVGTSRLRMAPNDPCVFGPFPRLDSMKSHTGRPMRGETGSMPLIIREHSSRCNGQFRSCDQSYPRLVEHISSVCTTLGVPTCYKRVLGSEFLISSWLRNRTETDPSCAGPARTLPTRLS
jgi:hypothetical protein